MAKKELEFEINDNILSVADFDWIIDRINLLYIDNKPINRNELSIFIETSNETDMLYFSSSHFKVIMKEFTKLCSALNDVNGNFAICGSKCFNLKNIKDIEYIKYFNALEPCYFVQIKFITGNVFEWDFLTEEKLKILLSNYNKFKEIDNNVDLQQ